VKCILNVLACQIKRYREKTQSLKFNIVVVSVLKNKFVIETFKKDRLKICTEEKNKLIAKKVKTSCNDRKKSLNELAYKTEVSRMSVHQFLICQRFQKQKFLYKLSLTLTIRQTHLFFT